METKIENHTIEYHWKDRRIRPLDEDSIGQIRNALGRRRIRGHICQLDGGFWVDGTWKDVTDDDILMFGFMNGWFK